MRNFLFGIVILINILVIIYILVIFNEMEYITVEIKGAVKYPNVYKLKEGSIVYDLLEESGGLLENSDTSVNNLAKRLHDEDVVIIYTKDEIKELTKGITAVKYIEKECICPKITNNSCLDKIYIKDKTDSLININKKISLNSSTKEELMTLKGIGESKAIKIIEYRDKNNGFNSIEEIMNVTGIGKSIYEKIKDYITL